MGLYVEVEAKYDWIWEHGTAVFPDEFLNPAPGQCPVALIEGPFTSLLICWNKREARRVMPRDDLPAIAYFTVPWSELRKRVAPQTYRAMEQDVSEGLVRDDYLPRSD